MRYSCPLPLYTVSIIAHLKHRLSLIKGIRYDIFNDIQGEELALSNIADIYQPQTISSSDLTTEEYWVYGANGIIGKYKEYNHETEQICITCRGNTCGTVNYTQPKVWITGKLHGH